MDEWMYKILQKVTGIFLHLEARPVKQEGKFVKISDE
jgi:hypothetical protein